ncbi:MAG: TolC family protein, partial [Sphingomonas bacterium]|nr:TolC family protein [Sphingomonas bacterium]
MIVSRSRLFCRFATAIAISVLSAAMAGATQPFVDVAAPAPTLREANQRALLLLPDFAANQALRDQVAAQRRAVQGPFFGPPVVSGDVVLSGGGLTEQEVGVSAGFRWPGESRAARIAADRNGEVIDATLDDARLRVAGQVRSAWWTLASAQAVIAVERGQAGIADQEVATVARLVDAGVQARRDLLLAQAERAAVLARLSASETDYVGAQAAYEALAGPAPARFPPELPAISVNIDQHPEVRAALARAAAAEARASMLRYT